MKSFKISFTVFDNFCYSRVVTGNNKDEAKEKLIKKLLQEAWDCPIKVKNISIDSISEGTKKR